MRTHNPSYARSEYHTQLAKMSFDKIFYLTAGVYFNFYNNDRSITHSLQRRVYTKSSISQLEYIFIFDKRGVLGHTCTKIQRADGEQPHLLGNTRVHEILRLEPNAEYFTNNSKLGFPAKRCFVSSLLLDVCWYVCMYACMYVLSVLSATVLSSHLTVLSTQRHHYHTPRVRADSSFYVA